MYSSCSSFACWCWLACCTLNFLVLESCFLYSFCFCFVFCYHFRNVNSLFSFTRTKTWRPNFRSLRAKRRQWTKGLYKHWKANSPHCKISWMPKLSEWKQRDITLNRVVDQSLFTLFASLTYAYHYLMTLIKYKLWILIGRNSFSYLWKFEPNTPNGFGDKSRCLVFLDKTWN